eukprot:gene11784-12857_t
MLFFALIVALSLSSLLATNASILFSETFENEDIFTSGKWVLSKHPQYAGQPVKVLPTGDNLPGFEKDLGVQLTQEMKHYGFGAPFSDPVTTTNGKDLFIQYELKFLETLNCGGAYVKLLRDKSANNVENLNSNTPYSIMFGPDKCGGTNKVHFILQYQNPVDQSWEEKHFNETVPVRSDKNTHLYTLAIHPDNTFEISVDHKEAKRGSLLTHFVPPINPEELIDDPTVKPDDWDESQPRKVTDPTATKPEGWLENEPVTIPNPDIKKPDDWDDEEDGEWEAPHVPNPACDQVGCGEWKAPLIENPLYKGKWYPPKIPNPAYKGVWAPKQIKNPTYFHEENPYPHIAPITALTVEVWTVNSGIHFDNFVIADSRAALEEFTAQTWKPKHTAEKKVFKKEGSEERQKERERIYREGSTAEKANAFIAQIIEYLVENPIALVGSALAIILPFVYLIVFGGSKPKVTVDGETIVGGEEKKEEDKQEEKEGVTEESDKKND